MGMTGLEPARLAALDPKSSVSANSTTSPNGVTFSENLECISLNYSVTQSIILGPNGPGDATVKLDTV